MKGMSQFIYACYEQVTILIGKRFVLVKGVSMTIFYRVIRAAFTRDGTIQELKSL